MAARTKTDRRRNAAPGPRAATEPVEVARFNFRFECQSGCVNCCTKTGDIFLNEDDIQRIATHLDLDRAAFEKQYVQRSKSDARLKVPSRDSCYFLQEGGCGIHEVKPLQCRAFPYWPENVANRASWSRLRRYCPGIGAGPLVQIETVRARTQEYRDGFPDL